MAEVLSKLKNEITRKIIGLVEISYTQTFCCLSESSPLPGNSTLNNAIMESIINNRKGPSCGSAKSAAIDLILSICSVKS